MAFSQNRPNWISNPKEACSLFELCAVGVGSGAMAAQTAARSELAKIFSSQVKGELKSSSTSSSKNKNDVLKGETSDDVAMTIEEKSEGIINAAVIKLTFEDKNSHYALIALKKEEGARAILAPLQILDEKILAFYKEGGRGSLTRALKLFEERQALHWRYEFLGGASLLPPVSYQQLVDKKLAVTQKNLTVFLVVDLFSETSSKKRWGKEIEHILAKSLLERDYKVTTRSNNLEYDRHLEVEFEKEKMHFNVEGFEKYKITAVLSAKNKAGEKISQINFVGEFTGRTFEQTLENALPDLKRFLNEHFDELNFE